MKQKVLLLIALIMLNGCDDVSGQYRHKQNHHEQQDQKNNSLLNASEKI